MSQCTEVVASSVDLQYVQSPSEIQQRREEEIFFPFLVELDVKDFSEDGLCLFWSDPQTTAYALGLILDLDFTVSLCLSEFSIGRHSVVVLATRGLKTLRYVTDVERGKRIIASAAKSGYHVSLFLRYAEEAQCALTQLAETSVMFWQM